MNDITPKVQDTEKISEATVMNDVTPKVQGIDTEKISEATIVFDVLDIPTPARARNAKARAPKHKRKAVASVVPPSINDIFIPEPRL